MSKVTGIVSGDKNMRPMFLIVLLHLVGLVSFIAVGNELPIEALSANALPQRKLQSTLTAEKELSNLSQRWASLWSEKRLDQLIELYASDSVFLTATGDRTEGKAAITDLFRMALSFNTSNLSLRSIHTEVSGTLGYDSGDYREIIGPVSEGSKREGIGNYLVVFRKDKDGRWLIVQHMWTDKR